MNIPGHLIPLHQPTPTGQTSAKASSRQSDADNGKIDKSSKEFETLLLTSWFQKAYESFGALPSNDSSEDLGSGGEQFQAIAMQGLASAVVSAGGIGVAKMMAESLRKSDHAKTAASDPAKSIPAVPPDISSAVIETNSPGGR